MMNPQSRRERGVIAQREYRKRHANKFKTLQDENDNLKDLLREVVVAAAKGHNQLDSRLQTALDQAKQVVGDQPDRNGTKEASRPTSQPSNEGGSAESETNEHDISAKSLDQAFEKSFKPIRSDDVYPPSTTSLYLGEGMFTIAGRLFWDHIAYINLQLQKQVDNEDRKGRYDPSDPRAEEISDYDNIVSLGSARLDYYRRLNQPLCNLSDDADSLTRLLHRQKDIKENALARRAEFWKNPTQVAELILERTSREEGHNIMAALAGRLGPREQKIAGQRLAPYAQHAVSFEDGPYWCMLFVSLHLGSYVSLSAGEITPTTHPGTY